MIMILCVIALIIFIEVRSKFHITSKIKCYRKLIKRGLVEKQRKYILKVINDEKLYNPNANIKDINYIIEKIYKNEFNYKIIRFLRRRKLLIIKKKRAFIRVVQ